MKNRLAEDIDLSLAEGWNEVDLEKGPSLDQLVVDDPEALARLNEAIAYERMLELADRREWASKNPIPCPYCGTEQVQLTQWFTKTLQYKCRHCKQKFVRTIK